MTLADIDRPALATTALPERSPRLLFVIRGAESYGTETKILGLLESMTERGARPTLYALGDGHLAEMARALPGLTVQLDPTAPPRFTAHDGGKLRAFSRTLGASAAWMRRLGRYLGQSRFDAMVICEHGLVLQIGAVARLAQVPAFWIMANDVSGRYRFDLNRRLYAFAFRHLRMIPVANSEHTRTTLGRGAGFAEKIDLGINPARLRLPDARPQPTADGRIRLLVMSRLVEGKGHKVLLQAMLSRPEFADMHLTLCGGPLGTRYEQELRDLAGSRGATDRLHLLGPVTDVARYYAEADVVVNARLDPEPFGLSIVEAMLMGKPVLAHALGGPRDIVVDGVTGWHVTAPAVAAFADGLARVLQDREHWAMMGLAARERAQRQYSHHTMTDQFLAIARRRLAA